MKKVVSIIPFKDLEAFVEKHKDKIIIVDFFTVWCGPCKWQTESLAALEKTKELKNDIIIVKIDIDKDDERAEAFKIKSIPTLMFYKNGVVQTVKDEKKKNTDRLIGFRELNALLQVVNELRGN